MNICLQCGKQCKPKAQYCSTTCLDSAREESSKNVEQKQRASTTLSYHEQRHNQASYW